MSTVVVTGAAGYIGGQISIMLQEAGHRVVGIDRRYYPTHLAGVFERYVHNDFASDSAFNASKKFQNALFTGARSSCTNAN